MRISICRTTSAILLILALPRADAGTLIPVVPYPGSSDTVAIAINDNNTITGQYEMPDGYHGFVGTLGGQYTSFDGDQFGGATIPNGINNSGWISGTYYNYDFCPAPRHECAFVRRPDGAFVTVTKDGRPLPGEAGGITAKAIFVGYYSAGKDNFVAYLGKAGAYQNDIDIGCPPYPFAQGINRGGTIVGECFEGRHNNNVYGFIQQNNTTVLVRYPVHQLHQTDLFGINDSGLATGVAGDVVFAAEQGVALDTNTDTFYPLEFKGASRTVLYGINNAGYIALVSDLGSFIYCPKPKAKCPGGTLHAHFGPGVHADKLVRSRIRSDVR